jgi:hypothetical protein
MSSTWKIKFLGQFQGETSKLQDISSMPAYARAYRRLHELHRRSGRNAQAPPSLDMGSRFARLFPCRRHARSRFRNYTSAYSKDAART